MVVSNYRFIRQGVNYVGIDSRLKLAGQLPSGRRNYLNLSGLNHLLVYCSHDSSFVIVATATTSCGLLLLGTSEGAGSLARGGGKLDELLGGASDDEGGGVNHLLADSDVALTDEDARLMDGSGKVTSDNEGLESALHELRDGQSKDVIEFALILVEETETDHASDEGITFENSSGIGIVHSQKSTGSLSIVRKSVLNICG